LKNGNPPRPGPLLLQIDMVLKEEAVREQAAVADLALRYDLRFNQVCAWKKQPFGNAAIARQF